MRLADQRVFDVEINFFERSLRKNANLHLYFYHTDVISQERLGTGAIMRLT